MSFSDKRPVRIAVLDLYEGKANQGMRCISEIIANWTKSSNLDVQTEIFDVRLKNQVPNTSFDLYISSGGPGDPLVSRFEDWDISWCRWVDEMLRWNSNPSHTQKKYVFFICHSFELACRYFNAGLVTKRRSTAFGIFPVHMLEAGKNEPVFFPVHMLEAGKNEPVFQGLRDPFYSVDSRDFQVIQPHLDLLNNRGAQVLCIEKSRPHVPYERAVMAIRFNDYMIGTQFHPEADARGMNVWFQTEEKRKMVIENHGEEKLDKMLSQLNEPDKIMWTYEHILPNFMTQSVEQLLAVEA